MQVHFDCIMSVFSKLNFSKHVHINRLKMLIEYFLKTN